MGHLNKDVQLLSQIPPMKLNMSFFFPVNINNMLHMQRDVPDFKTGSGKCQGNANTRKEFVLLIQ